jgi:hypothetical protein
MDPYPQPLNPAKEESFEAELDQITHHTEQGPRTALASPIRFIIIISFLFLIVLVICYSLFIILFSHATESAPLRFASELSRDERIIDKPIPHHSKAFTLHISKSKIDHPEAGFGTPI